MAAPAPREQQTVDHLPLVSVPDTLGQADVSTHPIPADSATPVIDAEPMRFVTHDETPESAAQWASTGSDLGEVCEPEDLDEKVNVPGYEIQGELGRGGMGVVYKAMQTGLKRQVALKMVIGHYKPSRAAVIRFLAEAEAVAAISHPNVVQVYEYGEAEGKPFMALEYVAGGSLAGKLEKGYRPKPEEAAALMAKVARGVAAAHDHGFIHRDLKPHNILLSETGEPKVADFGLAKKLASESDLTRSGAVLGTPAYMAPEQAKGQAKYIGPQADVWALGIMLYECLTGRRPFDNADAVGLLLMITTVDAASPRKVVPDIPRDLELICLGCLGRDPLSRYPTAGELADDLDRFLRGEPVTVHAPTILDRAYRWARRHQAAAAASVLGATTLFFAAFGGSSYKLYTQAKIDRDAAEIATTEAVKQKKFADDSREVTERLNAALKIEQKKTEENLVIETELKAVAIKSKDEAVEARKVAEEQKIKAVASAEEAKQQKAVAVKLQGVAEKLAGERAAALTELKAVRYGNTIGLAYREYLGNDLLRTRELLADSVPPGEGGRGWEWNFLNRASSGELVYIEPKAGRINSVGYGATGSRIVTAHADGTARLWDAKTGAAIREFRAGPADTKPAEIFDAALSPDASRLVTAGGDGVVRFWDTTSGTQIAAISPTVDGGKLPAVQSVAYSPDGKRFAAGDAVGTLRIWDADTRKEVLSVPAEVGAINSIRFSPNGRWLAVGGQDGGIKVWDRDEDDKKPAITVPKLKNPVSSVAISSAGLLVVGDVVGGLRLWDLMSGKVLDQVLAHNNSKIASVAMNAEGDRIATAGSDRLVKVWTIEGKKIKPVLTLKGHTEAVWAVAFGPSGKRLVSAGLDGTARVWDLTRPPEGWNVPTRLTSINTLVVSKDGSRVAAGGQQQISVFGLADDGPKDADPIGVRSKALMTETEPREFFGNLVLRFADDGKTVLGLSSQGELTTYEPNEETGRWSASSTVKLPAGGKITAAAFAPGNATAAVGRVTGEIMLWDVPGNRSAKTWLAHDVRVGAVAYSPDGQRLVTGAKDGSVKIWKTADATLERTLKGHTSDVLAVAFSPDGTRIATASVDHTARLWDAATGTELRALKGHLNWVRAVGFSPDGKRIITGGSDGQVKMWDAGTGFELLSLTARPDEVTGVTFSPDGSKLFVGGTDGMVRVYDATPVAADR